MNRNLKQGFILIIFIFSFKINLLQSQDFMMQGWYWDYPKTANGYLWAETLRLKAQALSQAGFTYVWLPPLSRAASGSISNGYDPKDLYDLGEYGLGPTGFGARSDVDALIATFDSYSIKAVADVVYNHRDGGKPENNPSVAGWIRNMTWAKINNGDQPYPSDRFRLILTVGGSTGRGSGTYYFKFGSKSQHSKFFDFPYKVYMETITVGYQGLPNDTESEPNGGGGCGESNNAIRLGVDMYANIDGLGCKIDEFALTLNAGDFDVAGDTIFIYLNNRNVGGLGDYSDHTVLELYYSGGGGNIESAINYQTWTDFLNLPSGNGAMNHPNFKPNGNPTQLAGDWDAMYFFYDYDQDVASTRNVLFDWTRWLWNDAGLRGLRLDAVKHFPYDFVGDLLDNLHDNSIDPGMVVGEFYDGSTATLKGWVDNVLANMDNDTKAAIIPRIFDFSLRFALEAACDQFGYDARNVFNASIVDAQGMSGFNAVTFVDNHDFRSTGQPVDNDPILAYAYILTNNQVGLPCVYYYDYYNRGLKTKINDLITVHQRYIFGASQRDYLSRFSTPYYQNFISGYASTTLVYQLSGAVSGRDVVVAINYAGETLKIDQQVNTTTMGLAVGEMLTEILANSAEPITTVDSNGKIYIELPPRSYSVWVEGDLRDQVIPVELTAFSGSANKNAVVLTWSTASETENLGFHIFRSLKAEGEFIRITDQMIPGKLNSAQAHHYQFTDENVEAGNTYFYKLANVDFSGNMKFHGTISVTVAAVPSNYSLEQNYPNPFNPETAINFSLKKAGKVSLKIYNLQGQLIRSLVEEERAAGRYSVIWDGATEQGMKAASGIYVCILTANNFEQVRKLTLLK